jgi:hypothetical protein
LVGGFGDVRDVGILLDDHVPVVASDDTLNFGQHVILENNEAIRVSRSTDNGPVDERGKRVGVNEALFRDVNERLRELADAFSVVTEEVEFVCECGDGSCAEQIRMPIREYEAIRSDAKRFFVVPGHEIPEYEKVVSEHAAYLVVEKLPGGPGGLAISEDPRS